MLTKKDNLRCAAFLILIMIVVIFCCCLVQEERSEPFIIEYGLQAGAVVFIGEEEVEYTKLDLRPIVKQLDLDVNDEVAYILLPGPTINSYVGTVVNKWGYKETYYNLPMDTIISIMRYRGYSEEEYPYWVREDGAKMFGEYVMVAADLSRHPRGEIVDCSLGKAIVVDTGSDIIGSRLDIATNW